MLSDEDRMGAFKRTIERVVTPGSRVIELGGGTGVLSYFAARRGASVICVERNPELVKCARENFIRNNVEANVEVVEADAFDYLPPHEVDVVICEMLHVGMVIEKQLEVIESFRARYLKTYPDSLTPIFLPSFSFNGLQPIEHSFVYEGFEAPSPVFQNPRQIQERSIELAAPVIYQTFDYQEPLELRCDWIEEVFIERNGELNAVRLITKNIFGIVPPVEEWFNNYLILPLDTPQKVERGDRVRFGLTYQAGCPISAIKIEASKV
jgi:protein arginine N-methyltransferase 1